MTEKAIERIGNRQAQGKSLVCRKIHVSGIVQGVGFRPFVYRLAERFGLEGFVQNRAEGVLIEIRGASGELDRFVKALVDEAPPASRIAGVRVGEISGFDHCEKNPARYNDATSDSVTFEIRPSDDEGKKNVQISPDLAICDECVAELFDPKDRRYRYPFINCTNCGPRFTIIEGIPYDRPLTSMKEFEFCSQCKKEYLDPSDRRFHAQPDCCPECGPGLMWVEANHGTDSNIENAVAGAPGTVSTGDPSMIVKEAASILAGGGIVAIKGLGGFHLTVDAASDVAVNKLRERKGRYAKPFAVMVRNTETVRKLAFLNFREIELLRSTERPIVLLRRREDAPVSRSVAPGTDEIGVMLPYTPLHMLLLAEPECPEVLVMTSGNRNDEPIVMENREALRRLSPIADYFVMHDRKIVRRVDDSVARINPKGKIMLLRRSRGWTPRPIPLPVSLPPMLAVGSLLKNTFCLVREGDAFLSQHIGDLDNPGTEDFFFRSLAGMITLFDIDPQFVVKDMHPDYPGARFAAGMGLPVVEVQHHHAHAAAVMAEHGLTEKVLAVILDGAGYGPDGTVWGGEFLEISPIGFRRVGRLKRMRLPGGDKAAKEPWRMAVSALHTLGGNGFPEEIIGSKVPSIAGRLDEIPFIEKMLENGINSPLTSSCGRLFDAVAALIGLESVCSFEGQAAIKLERFAWSSSSDELHRPYPVIIGFDKDGNRLVDTIGMLEGVIGDLGNLNSVVIARKFHEWLINSIEKLCSELLHETGIGKVVLSGGCFQNRFLLKGVEEKLRKLDMKVYTGEQVPVNDGGISLGQAFAGGLMYVSGNSDDRQGGGE